jgi:hypothetical protein
VLEWQIAAKPAPASAVAMASPPRRRPTHAAAAAKMPSATPLMMTNSAISRNSGTVMNS